MTAAVPDTVIEPRDLDSSRVVTLPRLLVDRTSQAGGIGLRHRPLAATAIERAGQQIFRPALMTDGHITEALKQFSFEMRDIC